MAVVGPDLADREQLTLSTVTCTHTRATHHAASEVALMIQGQWKDTAMSNKDAWDRKKTHFSTSQEVTCVFKEATGVSPEIDKDGGASGSSTSSSKTSSSREIDTKTAVPEGLRLSQSVLLAHIRDNVQGVRVVC